MLIRGRGWLGKGFIGFLDIRVIRGGFIGGEKRRRTIYSNVIIYVIRHNLLTITNMLCNKC